MANKAYLDVQWVGAKRDLAETLGLTIDQQRKLANWFSTHVFEVGTDYTMDQEFVRRGFTADHQNHIHKQMFYYLADEIYKSGLYMHTETNSPVPWEYKRWRKTVLVFGSPSMVGPRTGPRD